MYKCFSECASDSARLLRGQDRVGEQKVDARQPADLVRLVPRGKCLGSVGEVSRKGDPVHLEERAGVHERAAGGALTLQQRLDLNSFVN